MKKISILLALVIFYGSIFPQFVQTQKLIPDDLQSEDEFGNYVLLKDGGLFVGSYYNDADATNAGAVYYFTKSNSTWTQTQKLTPGNDAMADDHFGSAIARDQNYLLIAANADDTNGYYEVGSVYFFEYDGSQWIKRQKFVYGSLNDDDSFGWSVDICGNVAVIGAPGYFSYKGAVFVYLYDGSQWNFDTLLQSSDIAFNNEFGQSVSFDGNNLIVGASGKNSSTGAAYIFNYDGNQWTEVANLNASDAASNDKFGYSVALDGNIAVVGAYNKDNIQGAAYIFEYNGTSWNQTAKLTASDGASSDFFAQSVSISGTQVICGAWSKGDMTGAAYIYEKNGSSWQQIQKLLASDASSNSRFGYSVSIENGAIAIGAHYESSTVSYGGSVYIFSPPPPVITEQPSDAEICEGNQTQFSVVAQNATTYQWRKDGTELTDGGNISGATTATLTINNTSLTDTGTYDCIVSNSNGSVVSDGANLEVDRFSEAIAGQDTNICTAEITLNAQEPSYGTGYWTLIAGNGEIVNPNSHITDVNMIMPGVNVFRWTVTNGVCSDFDDITVTNDGIYIVENPSDQVAEVGDTISFEVSVLGNATFQWYKDGNSLENATDSILIIQNVAETDEGSYLCRISPISQCPAVDAVPAYLTVNPPSTVAVENIRFYPNPVIDKLIIDLPLIANYHIEIISEEGKILYSETKKSNKFILDFPYDKGIYFIKINNANFSKSFEIIK